MTTFLLREREVLQAFGLRSRTSLHTAKNEGLFPPGIRAFGRAVAWPSDEVQRIIKARTAGLNDDQLRELVKTIVAERAELAKTLLKGAAHA